MEMTFDMEQFIQNMQYFTMVPLQVMMWFLILIPNLHVEKFLFQYPQDMAGFYDTSKWFIRFLNEQMSL